MNEPVWICEELINLLHDDLIKSFGGSYGIRYQGLVAASLARPQHQFACGQPSIFDLAAAYGFAILKNHPFVDGNKRTALAIMAVLLEENGYEFKASEYDAVLIMERLADGLEDQDSIAEWLKDNSAKTP